MQWPPRLKPSTWQEWKDRQPHPEDWTVPGIAQRATLSPEKAAGQAAVQESLDRRG